MADYITRNEAIELINETFVKCGQPDLVGKVSISFNSRFTSRMGDARYRPEKDRGRIRLSSPLWHYASPAERRNTIIHEACHILAERDNQMKHGNVGPGVMIGRRPKRVGHGAAWRQYMRLAGIERVKRCHKVEHPLRRRTTRHPARCGCRDWSLTANRVGRMKNGRKYSCNSCKETLVLV